MYGNLLRRISSFPAMLAAMLTALGALTVRSRFDDPDLWWNLKTGKVIWTTHTIPTIDLFSYTTHHHPWVAHEWLAQLAIYAAYKWNGYAGLMLLFCTLTTALLVSGYALCSAYAGNAKVGFLGALTIWFFSTIGLSIRAQLFGYIFLIVELLIVHLGRTRSPRWFFWLPVLFAIWVNCHASFMLGIVVAATLWASSLFRFDAGPLRSAHWEARPRRYLGLALLLSLGALFLNPVGVALILYPLETMWKMPLLLASVAEYAPLQPSSGRGVGLLAILTLSAVLAISKRAELYWYEAILLAMGTWLAVSHVRMLFVFGILAAPVVSRQLAGMWKGYSRERDRPGLNAALAASALAVAWLAFPGVQSLDAQVEQQSPVKAVEFIKAHHLSGPMLNAHAFGGYLMWAAPEYPVFLDGRTDVFEWTGVLREYGDLVGHKTDPNLLLNKYGVNFCVLDNDSSMIGVLTQLPDWKLIYSDNNAAILAREPQQTRPLMNFPSSRQTQLQRPRGLKPGIDLIGSIGMTAVMP